MRHPIILIAALLGLPFVELALLLKLGALTDWKVPLLAVVVMAGVGIVLIRSIGWLTIRQFQEGLEHRRVPGNAILDTLCLLLAGLLFLFPGLLTDALGLLLLIPPTRLLVKRAIVGWIGAGIRDGNVTFQVNIDGRPYTVVDGEEAEDGDASDVGRTLPHHVRAIPRLDQLPESRRSSPPDDERLGRADEP